MERPPEFAGFSDIDRAEEPGAYSGYLDGVGALEEVAQWKERSFGLLGAGPGAALLDVGCGTGEDARALAGLVAPGGRVLGLDASAAMVAEARRRAGDAPGLEFRRADAQRMDLPDASFDGARCERTLQHLERPAAAVAEMARVVRPGGAVVAAEPDWGTLVIDAPDPGAGREVAGAAARRLRAGGVGRTLRRLFLDCGLAEVEVVARTLVVTDRARAEMLFDLTGAAEAAVRDGAISDARAASWLDGVTRAAGAGRLLVAMTAFMAGGRRIGH